MLTNDPAVDFFAWLLFSLVLIWALWQGVPEFTDWLAHDADAREDIRFFPDEACGEPGPGIFAESGGEIGPRDEHGRHGEAMAIGAPTGEPQSSDDTNG
jgi:hypothetical protein